MTEKKTNKLFGEQTNKLLQLTEENPDWEKYVTKKTAEIIKLVKTHQNFKYIEDNFGHKYQTVRAHIVKANDRIENKETFFRRGGKSQLAQELFNLMDTVQNWEEYVTSYEAELAKKYREVKNFYEMERRFGIKPGNVAGTLYGTNQKLGVITKIKAGIPQSERRDYTVLEENQKLEDLNK